MDCGFEFGARDFWKTPANFFVLEGKKIDGIAGGIFPSGGPSSAKLAVAIEQDQWFRWRRLNAEFLRHTVNLALARGKSSAEHASGPGFNGSFFTGSGKWRLILARK
jgi:hypothetical protein